VALEKLVHIEDPMLLPALMIVSYDVLGDLAVKPFALNDLPDVWRLREGWTEA
jgi:hypothetical protein